MNRFLNRLRTWFAPEGSDPWLATALAVVLIAGAWLFLDIAEDMMEGDPLVATDIAIHAALQAARTPALDRIMVAITECGDSAVVGWVAFALLLALAEQKAWRSAGFFLAAVAVGSALNTAIKVALHRARPAELYAPSWSAFSFPSGHSTVNLVLWGFLAVMLYRHLKPVARVLLAAAVIAFVGAIAFSRLYLGAHWFSDVVGGLAFGGAWTAGLGLLYHRRPPEDLRPARLLAIAALALVTSAGVEMAMHYRTDLVRYESRGAMATPLSSPVAPQERYGGGVEPREGLRARP